MIVHYGLGAANYSLVLSFLVLPYFLFFLYFENARLSHKQHKNVFKLEVTQDKAHPGVLQKVDRFETNELKRL